MVSHPGVSQESVGSAIFKNPRAPSATCFPQRLCFALLLTFLLAPSARAEKVEQLNPQGYVNDFASVLDAPAKAQLRALCEEVDYKAGAQIAVVTIHSLEGDTVEDFSHRLATRWGVGHKGDNRGVMVLLAVADHKYRVEVGYGLEPILPDGKVGGFAREMAPNLRAGDYNNALLRLTSEIATVIAQDRGVSISAPSIVPGAGSHQPPSGTQNIGWGAALVLLALLCGWGLLFITPLASIGRRPRRGVFWGGYGGGWGRGSFSGGGGGGFGGFGGGSFGGGGASGGW